VSAITRACGLLARAWESESDPRNTELGVIPDIAREMAVAAQHEEDQLRAELAAVKAERDTERDWRIDKERSRYSLRPG
jgi:hypothetical protein